MKLLAYDETTGDFIGWYVEGLHTTIPTPNIEVTEEDYIVYYSLMVNNGKTIAIKDGKITTSDLVMPPISWDMIRYTRDIKLSATDWTQTRDVPESVYTKYIAYRQALRDIPETFETPEAVVWPNPSDYGI